MLNLKSLPLAKMPKPHLASANNGQVLPPPFPFAQKGTSQRQVNLFVSLISLPCRPFSCPKLYPSQYHGSSVLRFWMTRKPRKPTRDALFEHQVPGVGILLAQLHNFVCHFTCNHRAKCTRPFIPHFCCFLQLILHNTWQQVRLLPREVLCAHPELMSKLQVVLRLIDLSATFSFYLNFTPQRRRMKH